MCSREERTPSRDDANRSRDDGGPDEVGSRDVMIDISVKGRHLLAKMAAIDPKPAWMGSPRGDTADYVLRRSALIRSLVARQRRVTSQLRHTLADMEQTEREVDWFLRNERERGSRGKYRVLERPEEFVSEFEKYSMEDFL